MTDNAGATDEHRALNYLAMGIRLFMPRPPRRSARSLTGVEVRPSPLSSSRTIVDIIFAYTDRNTDFTEKFFVRLM